MGPSRFARLLATDSVDIMIRYLRIVGVGLLKVLMTARRGVGV